MGKKLIMLQAFIAKVWILILYMLFSAASAQAESLSLVKSSEITNQLQIQASGFRVDHRTGELVQAITITNKSSTDIQGPLELVFAGLDPNITVRGARPESLGSTVSGIVNVLLLTGGEDKVLKPGQQQQHIIRFSVPSDTKISYRPKIFITPQTNN